jgi:hypothetical protein
VDCTDSQWNNTINFSRNLKDNGLWHASQCLWWKYQNIERVYQIWRQQKFVSTEPILSTTGKGSKYLFMLAQRISEYLILFVLAYPLQLVLQSLKHSLVMLTDSLVIVFCSMPYTLSKEQSHSEEFQTFLLREIAIIQGSQPHLQK